MSARNTFAATRRSHAILKRLRRGEGVTIRQVSEEFGIQYPQARADLKLLEELYDLDTYRDGRIKVWEMPGARDKATQVGIVAALELGGVALDIFKNTPYGERIDKLADDWRRRVTPKARERMERLSKGVMLRRNWLPVDSDRMLEALELFLDAIALKRGAAISYERSDGQTDDYLVVPRRLIWYHGRLWLQAIHERTQKLFDVAGVISAEKIRRAEVVDELVERRLATRADEVGDETTPEQASESVDDDGDETDGDDEQPTLRQRVRTEVEGDVQQWFEYESRKREDQYFADAFGIYAGDFEVTTVRLVVRNSWANYLRRYRVHSSQQNREVDEGLEVQFEIGLCPEFKSFLLGMIPDVEVKAPDHLRDELLERTRRWSQ